MPKGAISTACACAGADSWIVFCCAQFACRDGSSNASAAFSCDGRSPAFFCATCFVWTACPFPLTSQ